MSDTARELAEAYVEQRGFEPRPSSSGADARDLVSLLFAKGEARVAFLAGWNACEQQRPDAERIAELERELSEINYAQDGP